jgi:hypothetical protein
VWKNRSQLLRVSKNRTSSLASITASIDSLRPFTAPRLGRRTYHANYSDCNGRLKTKPLAAKSKYYKLSHTTGTLPQ